MAKRGKPLKFKTPEELETAIDAFFDECDEKEEPYTITGLAMALDIDRQTLINYGRKEDYFGTVKKARVKVENYLEKSLHGNAVTGTIFNLKNNFGWKDKQETEFSGGTKDETKWIVEFVEPEDAK